MLAIAGRTAGPNGLTFLGTLEYPGGNIGLTSLKFSTFGKIEIKIFFQFNGVRRALQLVYNNCVKLLKENRLRAKQKLMNLLLFLKQRKYESEL